MINYSILSPLKIVNIHNSYYILKRHFDSQYNKINKSWNNTFSFQIICPLIGNYYIIHKNYAFHTHNNKYSNISWTILPSFTSVQDFVKVFYIRWVLPIPPLTSNQDNPPRPVEYLGLSTRTPPFPSDAPQQFLVETNL